VTLLTGGVSRLPDALELARAAMRVVRQNLAWAFAYNVALVPIAAGVLVPWVGYRMPPALASAAMALSSISVMLSSLRLRRFEPKT
jgi:Cu+-exporting ATPase